MRGWQLVGRVATVGWECDLPLEREPIAGSAGDILVVSPYEDGRMFRCGSLRLRALGFDLLVCDGPPRHLIPALANGDYVFRATAIGENAFR